MVLPSTPKQTKPWIWYALVVVVIIVVVVLLVVFIPKSNNNDNPPAKLPEATPCKTSEDCDPVKVCGENTAGCCAVCGPDGTCQAGMITSKGCELPGAPNEEDPEKKPDDKKENVVKRYGMGWVPGWMNGIKDAVMGDSDNGSDQQEPAEQSEDSCMDDASAYQRACVAKGDLSPACCGVCVNGKAYAGVRGPDGVCQTAVQQLGYSGMGQQPPNTYIISSSGPKYGVSMGGCTVDPVGSSLAMHAGLYSPKRM